MNKRIRTFIAMSAVTALAGCGGTTLGGNQSSSAFDSGLSGSYGGYGGYGGTQVGRNGLPNESASSSARSKAAYPPTLISFEIPDLKSNPYDPQATNVEVVIASPDRREVKMPAFFDGGSTWKVRYAPVELGKHQVARVTLNGRNANAEKLSSKEFDASGAPTSGRIIRDPKNGSRFAFEGGGVYYPLGLNLPLEGKPETLAAKLDKIGDAGGNWARIFLTEPFGLGIDGKPTEGGLQPAIDEAAAKQWDSVIEAAEKRGIHLQVVLNTDAPFSTGPGTTWDKCDWNKKNGGFLSTPDEFFSDRRAIALTKARLRYAAARWGSSPAIMSWELFSHVERTDAVAHKHADEVSAWVKMMAETLRQQDPGRRLITLTGTTDKSVIAPLDFVCLSVEGRSAANSLDQIDSKSVGKPVLIAECGNALTTSEERETLLWNSLASDAAGGAQAWAGGKTDAGALAAILKPASEFLKLSGTASWVAATRLTAGVDGGGMGTLEIAAYGTSPQTEAVTILPTGPAKQGAIPSILSGSGTDNRARECSLKVNFGEAGTISVNVGRVSRGGSKLSIAVDGKTAIEKSYSGGPNETTPSEPLISTVPAGEHVITIANSGPDWLALGTIALAPYGPALIVRGRSTQDRAMAWVAPTTDGGPISGAKLAIPGLKAGSYRVTWFDPRATKPSAETAVEVAEGKPVQVACPAISHGMAMWMTKGPNSSGASGAPAKPTQPDKPEPTKKPSPAANKV